MLKVARSLRKLMLFIWGGLGGAQISQNTASGVKIDRRTCRDRRRSGRRAAMRRRSCDGHKYYFSDATNRDLEQQTRHHHHDAVKMGCSSWMALMVHQRTRSLPLPSALMSVFLPPELFSRSPAPA
ncbi:hypothetical protein RHMOL_Rhmol11G0070500 [Rhododendron molle]|uniref:Uncharacterized protein n=1 Tax=Rhododendron molle TaxID=49168 RepID=A0ACC0LPC6_RHOML|nr:hypothetical protein RHMOL_Rhmol11G0070500 [Rhododendron molle]